MHGYQLSWSVSETLETSEESFLPFIQNNKRITNCSTTSWSVCLPYLGQLNCLASSTWPLQVHTRVYHHETDIAMTWRASSGEFCSNSLKWLSTSFICLSRYSLEACIIPRNRNTTFAITIMIPLTDGNAQIQRTLNLGFGQKADPELWKHWPLTGVRIQTCKVAMALSLSSAFVCCSFRSASLDSKMNLPTLQFHHILLLFELWTLQKVGIRLWHGVKCTFQLEVRLHPAWAIFLLTDIPQFAHTWMEKQAEFGLHDLIPVRKYGNG